MFTRLLGVASALDRKGEHHLADRIDSIVRHAGYSTQLGLLKDVLKQGYDPYDYEWNVSDFLGQDMDVAEGEATNWIENASPEMLNRFRGWNNEHPLVVDDPMVAPPYETIDYMGMSRPRWQVHFTKDPGDIMSNGFIHGHPDIQGVQLTTYKRNRRGEPGFNFSFDADRIPSDAAARYGTHAVIFLSGAIKTYHHGDEEHQNIFWGPSVDPRMCFSADYDEYEGGWVISDWNDRPVFRSGDLRDCVGWIEKNWRQLYSTREKAGGS